MAIGEDTADTSAIKSKRGAKVTAAVCSGTSRIAILENR
jgi:hypothetical protein